MTLSIELQPRDGGWVQLGTQQDGGFGVQPASIEYGGDLNEYGCLDASWRMKLNPRWPRSIIEQFTPVVISKDGQPVWSGRIIAAPTTYTDDAEVVVQAHGWGQHLKDDCTDREWVINDLSRFVNTASRLDVTATGFQPTAPDANGGAILLPAPQGSIAVQNKVCSVTLDLGPNVLARKVVATIRQQGAPVSATWYIYARISNSPDVIGGVTLVDATVVNPAANTLYTLTPSHATGGRYVSLFWYWNGATTAAISTDLGCKVESCLVFTDTADESGNASILKASTVISETLDAVAPLISSDRSKILSTSTSIPNFPGKPGYNYANELIDQANSLHGWVARLSPDPVPVFEFAPQPTDYNFMVGAGEYTLLEPAAQDGRSVYNRIISEYEDAAGVRDAAIITAPTGATYAPASTIVVSNPSFTVDTTGYVLVGGGAIARSTVAFNTSPASLTLTGGAAVQVTGIAGSLVIGQRYRVSMFARQVTADPAPAGQKMRLTELVQGGVATASSTDLEGAAFQTIFTQASFSFTATSTTLNSFTVKGGKTGVDYYVDDFAIETLGSNLVDQRSFRRTALRPPGIRTTAATAQVLAQLELDNSQYPPFKGTIGITDRIRTKGGASLPVEVLPASVGDMILIENLTDPNTGALGRVGVIQTAKFNEATRRVELTIDSNQRFLQQLRARIALGV